MRGKFEKYYLNKLGVEVAEVGSELESERESLLVYIELAMKIVNQTIWPKTPVLYQRKDEQ